MKTTITTILSLILTIIAYSQEKKDLKRKDLTITRITIENEDKDLKIMELYPNTKNPKNIIFNKNKAIRQSENTANKTNKSTKN